MSNNSMLTQNQRDLAQAAYNSLPGETKDKVCEWITTTIAPATSIYDRNSYSIKHDAEQAIGVYIRNEEFKGAMLACGHPPTARSANDLNWQFRIKSNIPRAERPPFGHRGLGGLLRQTRQAQHVGLRELARRVNISPAYLSKIETGQLQPPAEDKLVAMAQQLNLDSDALLAQAGRVPTDVLETIKQQPAVMNKLIRTAGELLNEK
jgi:transcriptional regulator with XRE-family HTH domain